MTDITNMKTFFAKAERKDPIQIKNDLELVLQNHLVSDLLYLLSGVVMIINQERQILMANQTFLEMVGEDSAENLLGIRPGEALKCVHAFDNAAGCGTGEACASCGAALAIVTSLCEDKPVEQYCALSVNRNGQNHELYLKVRAAPFQIDEVTKTVLICMQDVTEEHRWANLERVFYHDVNNLITALLGRISLMDATDQTMEDKYNLEQLHMVADQLVQEVSVQQYLSSNRGDGVFQKSQRIELQKIIDELSVIYRHHPKKRNRRIVFPDSPRGSLISDFSLIVRIVGNMITNALEASSDDDGEVTLSLLENDEEIGFMVWNREYIPASVQPRIFQRHFTTKKGFSRGLGTYSMKLLGEHILGGRVEFSSSPSDGTAFTLWLKKA